MRAVNRIEAPTHGGRRSFGAASRLASGWVPCLLLLCLAVLVRSLHLNVPPYNDELYTMLAARGWLVHGVPSIANGVYDRAWLYTIIVAHFLQAFGDSLVVGRLPSLIAGSLLVVAVFLWTRSVAGARAAWIAALFVCLDPLELLISQFTRFYALFDLVFWLGAIGVYSLVEMRPGAAKASAIALGSVLCFVLALHLQVLTLMGLCGLGLWVAYAFGLPWWRARQITLGRLKLELAIGVALLLMILVGLIATGIAGRLATEYRWVPVWNAAHRNEIWFYHVLLLQRYQSLWPIFPFLVMLAIARRPKPAIFCFVVFVVALVLLSCGGMKDRRYISFVMPFLFVLWSIALAEAWPFLRRCLATTIRAALYRLAPALASRPAVWAALALSVLFLIVANGAPTRTLFQLAGLNVVADDGGAGIRESRRIANWAAARAPLQPLWNSVSVVLTSHDVQTLYYLGDYDIVISNTRISETHVRDFGIDWRTGLPVVHNPKSVRLIMDCYPSGLIVTAASTWRTKSAIDDAVADVIEAGAKPVPLPAKIGILAFHWKHSVDHGQPPDCAGLPPLRRAVQ